jgi:hypothetical protein
MKYLIANHLFGGRTGSELWSYELGRVLTDRHHAVEYFGVDISSRHISAYDISHATFQAGASPTPHTPDIIVAGQYTTVAHLARLFPDVPIVQVLHGITDGLDTPAPDLPNLVHYVCVSPEVYHRARKLGNPASMMTCSSQLIDDHLFTAHADLNDPPRHLLLISRRMNPRRRSLVEHAAGTAGLTCLWIPGTTGELSPAHVAGRIHDADIVVGMGRAIPEALMCGRNAIVYDIHGCDGLVTDFNFERLAFHNFSGRLNHWDPTTADFAVHLEAARHNYLENLTAWAEKHAGASWIVAKLDLLFQSIAWNWNHYPDRIARDKHPRALQEAPA